MAPPSTALSRRTVLRGAAAGAAVAIATSLRPFDEAVASAPAAHGSFGYGVASGDPTAYTVVIWTRAIPPAAAGQPVATPGSGLGRPLLVSLQRPGPVQPRGPHRPRDPAEPQPAGRRRPLHHHWWRVHPRGDPGRRRSAGRPEPASPRAGAAPVAQGRARSRRPTLAPRGQPGRRRAGPLSGRRPGDPHRPRPAQLRPVAGLPGRPARTPRRPAGARRRHGRADRRHPLLVGDGPAGRPRCRRVLPPDGCRVRVSVGDERRLLRGPFERSHRADARGGSSPPSARRPQSSARRTRGSPTSTAWVMATSSST